jgi:23S rRNA pseudouridine2605 synthase
MPHGQSPKHTRKARKKSATPTDPKASAGSRAKAPSLRSKPGVRAGRGVAARADESQGGPNVSPIETSIRLQKWLASAGFGSRRDVEQFLIDERVTVNGHVAKLGERADPSVDDIRLDGERVVPDRPSYWIVNKPRGMVTTVRDEEGRRKVIDLLPDKAERVFPVGRLDRETSGLLLLTNDGDMAHVLLHPSLGNEREYRVHVKGLIDERAVTRLAKGVPLEEGRTAPAKVKDVRFDSDAGTSSFSLVIVEGRKRQIRRSLLVLGFPVRRLVRVRMGPLRLGRLAVGQARRLRPDELRNLRVHVAQLRASGASDEKSGRKPRVRRVQRTESSRKGTSR